VGLVFTIDSNERIGLESFLTSEALANVAFSLFGGQSALVFRITGPTLAFLQVVRITASRLNAHMVTFYSIVALVSGLSSMLFASFSGASLIKYVGRFFAECLRMFVAVIFMYSSINAMRNKGMQSAETVSEFLKYFILHIGTFTLSRKIQSIKTSPFLKTTIRKVLSDLAPAIGLLVFTGVSYIAPDVPVDRVHDGRYKLSGTMWPTYTPARYSEMKDNPKSVLVACFCGVSLAVQVFFESQISAVLSNRPENKLKKGKSYHYDYFIVGVINALQGLFGLPIAIPSLAHPRENFEFERRVSRRLRGKNAYYFRHRKRKIYELMRQFASFTFLMGFSSRVIWRNTCSSDIRFFTLHGLHVLRR
jgi:hypothetical protein